MEINKWRSKNVIVRAPLVFIRVTDGAFFVEREKNNRMDHLIGYTVHED